MIPFFPFNNYDMDIPSPALPRTRLHKVLCSLPSVPAHRVCQLLVHCNSSCFNFDLLSPAHNRPYHGEARFSKSLHSREGYAYHLGQSTEADSPVLMLRVSLLSCASPCVLFRASISLPVKCACQRLLLGKNFFSPFNESVLGFIRNAHMQMWFPECFLKTI